MENSPELDGKYLGTITHDFLAVCDNLKEAAYQLKIRGISEYPIFPISKSEVPIGQLFLAGSEVKTQWNYNFSYLGEFVQKRLVEEEKIEDFKKAFKNPEEFCCFFVIDGDFTKFVFIPYPED